MRNVCYELFLVIVNLLDLADHVVDRVGKIVVLVACPAPQCVGVVPARVLERRLPDLSCRISRYDVDHEEGDRHKEAYYQEQQVYAVHLPYRGPCDLTFGIKDTHVRLYLELVHYGSCHRKHLLLDEIFYHDVVVIGIVDKFGIDLSEVEHLRALGIDDHLVLTVYDPDPLTQYVTEHHDLVAHLSQGVLGIVKPDYIPVRKTDRTIRHLISDLLFRRFPDFSL